MHRKNHNYFSVLLVIIGCCLICGILGSIVYNVNNLYSEFRVVNNKLNHVHNELLVVQTHINILSNTTITNGEDIDSLNYRVDTLKADVENFKDIYNRHTHPSKKSCYIRCWLW